MIEKITLSGIGSTLSGILGKARSFSENRLALLGSLLLLGIIFVAIFAPVIAPYSPSEQNTSAALEPPSMAHPFGTDDFGRDIFSRILFGYRNVLGITFSGVFVAGIVGTTMGLSAGYFGGWIDDFLMRGVDVLMTFPSLVLGLGLIAVLGPSRWSIALVLAVAYTPIFARVSRSESASIREKDFIKALEVRGASHSRIIFGHILPNSLGPLFVTITLQLAFGIITAAALSFLGLGIQPPNPSLGRMLSEGQNFLSIAWWMAIFPGISIMLPVLGFNTVGDGLRESFDPRQSRG